MLAIRDPFTPQLRGRLKTTCMGLGLVRLLQDARRFEEARATLATLENGFERGPDKSDQAIQKPCNFASDWCVPGFSGPVMV
jgi:hypothetical protein